MKKLLTLFLAFAAVVFGSFGFASCGGKTENTENLTVDVYAPDGAPALALARLMDEEMKFGAATSYNVVPATTIQTYVTGDQPAAELAVLPVNDAASLLGKGDKYQMLGVVTHGNLFILSKSTGVEIDPENAAEILKGKKIGSLQLNNFVGFALRTVLNKYGVEYEIRQNKEETNDTQKAYLYEVVPTEITPAAKFDYMIAAEPAVSAKVKGTEGKLKIVGNLQSLYGEKGYPQAVLAAKTEFIRNNAKYVSDFTAAVSAAADWLTAEETTAERVVNAVSSHLPSGTTPSFNAKNLTREVIKNCAVRYETAESAKKRVNAFLAEISTVTGKSFAVENEFFYMS